MKRFEQWLRTRLFHYLGCVQEPWYTYLNALANRWILFRHPEKLMHPGTLHPDKTFYIIKDIHPDVGVAGWYDRVLGYVLYAERKGWIPVVDPDPPAQADDGDWYAFFDGPSAYRPKEAWQGRNVVLATPRGMIHKRYSRKNVATRHEIVGRIPLSREACEFVDRRIDDLFKGAQGPMVGVRYRGTDYRAHGDYCPTGHAKVPEIELFCELLERDLASWGIPIDGGAHLFVVTEEQEALDALKRRYPKCRYVEKERYANFQYGRYLAYQRLPSVTPKENNLFYLLEIYALGRCDYLMGGVNGGVLMALTLNGNRYRGVHVINTGVN